MKTTKTQIKAKTESKKGQGFNPSFKHSCDINKKFFETQFLPSEIIACTIDDKTGEPIFDNVGYCENKKQFINEVYNYLNK